MELGTSFSIICKPNWNSPARFVVFRAEKIQVEVFCVMIPRSVVGYQRFGGQCCLHLQGGGRIDLRNVGVLPQHYTVSQPRRRPEILMSICSLFYSIQSVQFRGFR